MRSSIIYWRCFASVAIPIAVRILFSTRAGDACFNFIASRSGARWGAAVALCALLIFEMKCLGTLIQLIHVRGCLTSFNARLTDPVRRLRARTRRFGVVTAAVSTLVAFLLAELVFRVFNIQPPPIPPSHYFDAALVDNTLNALGIREDWDELAPDDHRTRIALLGDSMTYGWGVEPDETFCRILEDSLDSTGNPPCPWVDTPKQPGVLVPDGVVTINLGQPATAPGTQLRNFLAVRDILNPDVLVHVIYINDLGIDLAGFLSDIYRVRDENLWVGDASFVLRYAERQIRYWLAWKRTIAYFRGGRNQAERAHAWRKLKTGILACKQAAEEGGAVYALVLFPWLTRLDDHLLDDFHRKMADFATDLDVPYLDLLTVFMDWQNQAAGRKVESLRISSANEHPNPAGHRIAADEIASFLCEKVLPKIPPPNGPS